MNQRKAKHADRSKPSLMNTFEAAAWLRLSPGHLMNMRSQGTGPDFCRLGKSIRYSRTDLQAWVERGRIELG